MGDYRTMVRSVSEILVSVRPLLGGTAALIVLSLIPVAMTSLGEPNLSESRALNLKTLYAASPVGMVGAVVSGVMIGSFYALGVVFARRIGLSVAESAMFMSVVVLGGLVFQLPIGALADRLDRRLVMSVALILVGGSWAVLLSLLASGVPFATTRSRTHGSFWPLQFLRV
ncbi:hypothetical protein FE848_15860 [Marinobacter sp. 1-3A]|uniref:hypothetical protein n=1 Tax=Marinobacter sp. 1-3A TaxID=2582920 RepID=UPI0019087B03|nr:hypothetical protein [Marinobacter sp. 1-3A]MBK1874700.1 hypothetical protein [Marinobacter sp. 1-3A]